MRKLMNKIDRFCYAHPRFGIPNLMLIIVIGNAAVWLLTKMDTTGQLVSLLSGSAQGILHGQVWRLVTYVFVPTEASPIWLLVMLYFYYWIGSTLEREWGTPKFTLYYLGGAALTVVGVILTSLISGNYYLTLAGTGYVNLSMFLAFAFLYPDTQLLLFFFIPVKIKWLAWLDIAVFVIGIVQSLLAGSWLGAILPVVALLNFLVFIWPAIDAFIQRRKYRHAPQTVNFKKAVRQQQQQKGYHHKCAVCGRTDTDYPELQFRYCSKCAGYHCFCQDHIFNHVHFTE